MIRGRLDKHSKLILLALVCFALLWSNAPALSAFSPLKTCNWVLTNININNLRFGNNFGQKTTKASIKLARSKALVHWASYKAPESLEGLSEAEALSALQSLKQAILDGRTSPVRVNSKVVEHQEMKNGITSGIVGLIKFPSTTLHPTRDMTHQITTRPRSEMIAYLMDRLFGFNIVPPVIMFDDEVSLQLKIRQSHLADNFAAFSTLGSLMSKFYLGILDRVSLNRDRYDNPGNTRLRDDGHVLGIDFDLSTGALLMMDRVQFDFPKMMTVRIDGKNHSLPLITSRRVYNQLKSLTKEKIIAFARAHDTELYTYEINRIHGYARGLAIYLDYLISIYGENLILFDEDKNVEAIF